MRTTVNIAILLALLAATGCGPRISRANIDVVNRQFEAAQRQGRSLSAKEVESILGQPSRVETHPIEQPTVRVFPVVRYIYEQQGNTIELHFVEGRLIRHVTNFGEPPPQTAPLTMPKTGLHTPPSSPQASDAGDPQPTEVVAASAPAATTPQP